MPVKKSAKKALRRDDTRAERNKNAKGQITYLVKQVMKSLKDNKLEDAKKTALETIRLIDKAENRNVFKKNTAARKKSSLMRHINTAGSKKPETDQTTTTATKK